MFYLDFPNSTEPVCPGTGPSDPGVSMAASAPVGNQGDDGN